MDNIKLVKGILEKNEQAFNELYSHYHKLLYFVIFQVVNDSLIAEELLQEAFMKIYSQIHTYQNGNFKYWIVSIARNLALNYATRVQVKDKQLVHDDTEVDKHPYPSTSINEIDALLRKHFSDDMRQIIIYKVIFDYSYQDIALILEKDVKHIIKSYKASIPTLKLILSEVVQ